MLQPKRVKYRRPQDGRGNKGNAHRGTQLAFGSFGIKTLEAKWINSRQIEHMIAYRRAIKMAVANTMRAGAEGIKIQITGRLNGAEMARKEMYKEGRTPLHTFRADIDYCQCEALTKVGLLGIKVWICRGEVYGKADLTPNFTQDNKSNNNNRGNGRSNNRGGNRKRNNNR